MRYGIPYQGSKNGKRGECRYIMTAKEVRNWIDSLTDDIEFQYNGKYGVICPWNRQDISLCYDEQTVSVHSVGEAMTTPFIEGGTLEELAENIDFG